MRPTLLPATPSFRLEGKTALVTGGSRGLGLAASAALAEAGAHVYICARNRTDAGAAAEAIRDAGGSATALCLDITDTVLVDETLRALPAFDILVNNAGTNRPRAFTEASVEDYDAIMSLNVKAAFFTAQTVARGMIDAGKSGSLIHIGSQMGQVGGEKRSLYCASKWALEGMSKAIALDLAQYNIRSNVIAPTFVETPMTQPFFEDKAFRAAVVSKIKLGRIGKLEDIMGAVVFLASDAASLMTGSTLTIDGGWTAD